MGQAQQASELSYKAIQEYAERIGTTHGIYDQSGGAKLGNLVSALGGHIEYVDSDESLLVTGKHNFVIYLPTRTSQRRDQFTLAHELGHYFLHYLQLDKTEECVFKRGGQSQLETQANFFAASLLMPEEAFKRQFELLGPSYSQIAHLFGVSPAAAEVRAEVLGLK